MHYSRKFFSANGGETITPKIVNSQIKDRLEGFSPLDLQKLNKYYDCPGRVFGILAFSNISFGFIINTNYRKNLPQQSKGRKPEISDSLN